ncbi:MAG TPA: retropepsin-like aspartic protease [Candidatus Elarobacter sp.]
MRLRPAVAAAFACAALAALSAAASAEWRPPDVRATKTTPADVLGAYAKWAGTPDPRFAQRREHWTYVNGERRFPVQVAVRGDDFRATVALGGERYAGGRDNAVRWRANPNGITHATLTDDQADAVDVLPQSVFPFALADCELAGESERFGSAWVLVDRAPRDKPHWFYVEKASGALAHEITREGRRTIVTAFDRFESIGSARRARHWRIDDGDRGHQLDVTVDAIEPGPVQPVDVAIPQTRRTFTAPSPPPNGVVTLPAHFLGRTIFVDVDVDGSRGQFVLDTGTASITLDRDLAERRRWGPVLEHASVPHMRVGALRLDDVSTLAIPLGGLHPALDGILGYDFFFGNVVHVDYEHNRVEALTPQAAAPAFADAHTFVVPAYFDEGSPMVHAAFGPAAGDRFILDTGSPQLFVLAPFVRRYEQRVAAWRPDGFGGGRRDMIASYLEGSIHVAARSVSDFRLGPFTFAPFTVGVEERNDRADAIDIAADAIVGTDQMAKFDWWFDYDGGRIAVRRNGLR